MKKSVILFLSTILLFNCSNQKQVAEWRSYASDQASTKYSSLDQINKENISQVTTAWEWESIDEPLLKKDSLLWTWKNESTPIMVNGVLYTSTSLSQVAALDAETGKTIWTYNPESYKNGNPPNLGFLHRGVAYWEKGDIKRIFIATGDAYLIGLNAITGLPDESFGDKGRIDLTQGLRRPVDRVFYGVSSPPVVCRDRVIVGSSIIDYPANKEMPPGDVRAFDPITGEVKWVFESIPQNEVETKNQWDNESWKTMGNTNVWSMMSADEELGYVYLPFGTPTNDYYGGERPGDNRYAESLVAVEVETGKIAWHFQGVHHGIWDYDFPAAPNLVDITVDGKKIKAVAQVSKQAFTYVLNRETGEPVWPIEEKSVPQSDIQGEATSPTQPFPTKPKAFDRQGLTEDDIVDFTPEIKQGALDTLKKFKYGPLFTPPSLQGTVAVPGVTGGASWSGAAIDPVKGILYIPSLTLPGILTVFENKDIPYRYMGGFNFRLTGPYNLPITKPPYGRITAIDLNTGEHLWMTPIGKGPKDNPAIKHLSLPDLGTARRNHILLTKTVLLVFQEGKSIARPSTYLNAIQTKAATDNPLMRALDPQSGKIIAEIPISENASGAPITYMWKGKQYIVVPVGGASLKAKLIALRLPD